MIRAHPSNDCEIINLIEGQKITILKEINSSKDSDGNATNILLKDF